ncbi:MAG: NAD(P)/FAD-dependent oxidoreductase [Acholeplasmataceae bacterium]
MYDYLIIGSGIVGSAIARELSFFEGAICLVEKSSDITNGQTIANSGIIHSGHDPKVGSLKARLCVKGNDLYENLALKLDFPLLKTGALVVAFTEEELSNLDELFVRARKNGVKEIARLTKEETLKLEPNLNETLLGSLSLPSTKTTVPWEASRAMLENAIANGLTLKLNHEVKEINIKENYYEVCFKNQPPILTKGIINACGLFSDEIMGMLEDDLIQIYPRRGEYYTLSHGVKGFVSKVIYPVPSSLGKGVLMTPQPDGHLLVGPNAEDVSNKEDNQTTIKGLNEIKKQALRLSNKLPFKENIKNFAGLRAKIKGDDFYINRSTKNKNVYHLVGIDSPGLTAAPAIGKYVIDLIKEDQALRKKLNVVETRTRLVPFFLDTKDNQKKRWLEHPSYGELVCRCERISKQDIINEVTGLIPATSIKAIKKRTRATAGLCQGGYCESRILEIIASCTNKELSEVNYYEEDTPILIKEMKVEK